jgi:DNA (cytosine-5)-methyltransferase 1
MTVTLEAFRAGERLPPNGRTFASLFSGGGIGDLGLVRAGWAPIAALERDPLRAETLRRNTSVQSVHGDIRADAGGFVDALSKAPSLDLLIATPPCQSFSSAYSKRGSFGDPEIAAKDERNSLVFEALTVASALKPKIIVFENVPAFFMRRVATRDGRLSGTIGDFAATHLRDYHGIQTVLCMSTFGVPQRRRRAIGVFVRKDLFDANDASARLVALLAATVHESPTAGSELRGFRPLDGKNADLAVDPDDRLHRVPTYDPVRYGWISEIPPGSGRSAYENDRCQACQKSGVPVGLSHCDGCGSAMSNRPHVVESDGTFRLVKGFGRTSYRRMRPEALAATITTASSHFGSDVKLHPWQNRVLSARECAHLQTVPREFDWSACLASRRGYAIRQIIGEAVPSWFAFQLGYRVDGLLAGR